LGIGVDVGNDVSDPIVSLGVQFKLRPRIAAWLDWLLPDRRGPGAIKGWCTGRS
jgi:hypothetical protein